MKTTGVIRAIDELGRLVIPKEFRRRLDVKDGEAVEINLDGDRIIITRYQDGCHLCGSSVEKCVLFKSKKVCSACLAELKELHEEE